MDSVDTAQPNDQTAASGRMNYKQQMHTAVIAGRDVKIIYFLNSIIEFKKSIFFT